MRGEEGGGGPLARVDARGKGDDPAGCHSRLQRPFAEKERLGGGEHAGAKRESRTKSDARGAVGPDCHCVRYN